MDEILGLGPLQALMDAPGIEDIAINGPHEVYVFAGGWERSPVRFESAEELTVLVNRAISHTGRQVSALAPRVDAQLRDGSRIAILHPSVASPGPAVTIRRYTDRVLRMLDLVRAGSGGGAGPRPPARLTDYLGLGVWDGTITPQAAAFLELCVLARLNLIVVGGTGAGKTTLLNALAELIPLQERIVTIEDTRELRLRHGSPPEDAPEPAEGTRGYHNAVHLTVRYETVEGARGVDQQALMQSALRMRPDRLVVGEVRGAEALDLLMAHNTGHDGGMTTLHANSLAEVPKRLAQMIQLNDLSIKIDRRTVAEWVAGAFQIGVFVRRDPATNRRAVTQIVEYTGQVEGEAVLTQPLFDLRDGLLRRTPYRLHQESLLARVGHSYDTIVEMDRLAPVVHPAPLIAPLFAGCSTGCSTISGGEEPRPTGRVQSRRTP
jgi:pilus assembly protein CpaF